MIRFVRLVIIWFVIVRSVGLIVIFHVVDTGHIVMTSAMLTILGTISYCTVIPVILTRAWWIGSVMWLVGFVVVRSVGLIGVVIIFLLFHFVVALVARFVTVAGVLFAVSKGAIFPIVFAELRFVGSVGIVMVGVIVVWLVWIVIIVFVRFVLVVVIVIVVVVVGLLFIIVVVVVVVVAHQSEQRGLHFAVLLSHSFQQVMDSRMRNDDDKRQEYYFHI
jgi:hypothetical protein